MATFKATLKLRSAALAALMLFAANSLAWIDTGHILVAAIAEKGLQPIVLAKVRSLLKVGGTDTTRTLWTASCWADDAKTKENGVWHYINVHFRDDGKPTDNRALDENVVWAINRFSKVLADGSRSQIDRADALRFLIHFVGDIHQPMHTVARDSAEFPRGDRGGNDFHIVSPAGINPVPNNLHFLWDMAGGLYGSTSRPLDHNSVANVEQLRDSIMKEFPKSSLTSVGLQTPSIWKSESYDLARKFAYAMQPNGKPSTEYLTNCKRVCKRQIALAGYRLADLLNNLLK